MPRSSTVKTLNSDLPSNWTSAIQSWSVIAVEQLLATEEGREAFQRHQHALLALMFKAPPEQALAARTMVAASITSTGIVVLRDGRCGYVKSPLEQAIESHAPWYMLRTLVSLHTWSNRRNHKGGALAVTLAVQHRPSLIPLLVKAGVSPMVRDVESTGHPSVLLKSFGCGSVRSVKTLFNVGAVIGPEHLLVHSPFFQAASNPRDNGLALFDLLESRGYCLKPRWRSVIFLNSGVVHRSIKVSRRLQALGADLTALDDEGKTALHRLLFRRCESIPLCLESCEMLLEQGVDVNARDDRGRTAAWYVQRWRPSSGSPQDVVLRWLEQRTLQSVARSVRTTVDAEPSPVPRVRL